jgi:PPOX class probable F420-dependent enzyme
VNREKALDWLGRQSRGVIATIKRDGRPQLSNVSYALVGDEVRVSVTADRAKTRNLERDPRVSMHVTTERFYPYVVAEGEARLSPPTTAPDDTTADQLVDVYRRIAGEHPDWDEFRQAMIDERRLVLRFTIDRLYGVQP